MILNFILFLLNLAIYAYGVHHLLYGNVYSAWALLTVGTFGITLNLVNFHTDWKARKAMKFIDTLASGRYTIFNQMATKRIGLAAHSPADKVIWWDKDGNCELIDRSSLKGTPDDPDFFNQPIPKSTPEEKG